MNLPPYKKVIESLFLIPNKAGQIVDFKLNCIQDQLDAGLTGRDDILKARQEGVSIYLLARFLVDCMRGYCRVVMITHDKEHTEKLLERGKFMLEHMKGGSPVLGRSNESALVFQKTGASLYIGTAGAKQFGRSDTVTHAHCSEVAFWKDPKSLLKGLFQAVPHDTGILIKESTANGFGTYHHKSYNRAKAGLSRYKAWFFSWFIFPEYTSNNPLNSPLDETERLIKKLHNLTNGQIQWRREKLEEMDGDESIFKQEYPSTPEEAFLLTGGSLFPITQCVSTPDFKHEQSPIGAGRLRILTNHPNPNLHYSIGVDSAAGVGGDNSVIEVFCTESGEEVCTYASNKVPPPQFASVVAYIGLKFSTEGIPAYMVPERNQHGITVVALLRENPPYKDYLYRIFRDPTKKSGNVTTGLVPLSGFVTGGISKYRLIGILQNIISTLTFHDEQTVDEITGFSETALGTMTNKDSEHDDRVIACALAAVGILRERRMGVVALITPSVKKGITMSPFKVTFEDIMENLKKQNAGNNWFKPQHEVLSPN